MSVSPSAPLKRTSANVSIPDDFGAPTLAAGHGRTRVHRVSRREARGRSLLLLLLAADAVGRDQTSVQPAVRPRAELPPSTAVAIAGTYREYVHGAVALSSRLVGSTFRIARQGPGGSVQPSVTWLTISARVRRAHAPAACCASRTSTRPSAIAVAAAAIAAGTSSTRGPARTATGIAHGPRSRPTADASQVRTLEDGRRVGAAGAAECDRLGGAT
jgi:hypothetical protein